MYEAFFGFRERPFDLSPDPRYLVLTPSHREALGNLEYGIASQKGITLLVGEAGSGKTTVIRAALERQTSRVHYVHLHNPALTREEFVEMLGVRFGLSERSRVSKTALLLELEELLESRHAANERTVLVVDEAQSLPNELLEEIRLLANVDAGGRRSMSVIMAGQPELAARLNTHELRQFKQRVALRCELKPLNLPETAAYVTGRIAAAGGEASRVVTREALELLHARAGGIPRTINVIADNTLLTAFAAGRRPAVASMVEEVCRDFDLAAPAEGVEAARADLRSSALTAPAAPEPALAPAPPVSVASGAFGSLFGSPRPRRRRFSFFS